MQTEKTVKQFVASIPNPIVKIGKQKYLFLLLLPGLVYFLIFKYYPMYGIIIAFKEYDPLLGILHSPWAGLKYFNRLFESPYIWTLIENTLKISFLKILFGFPAPILFALLLNEIVRAKFKRVLQTISYLPHFLSWVVVAGVSLQVFSPSYGIYGYIYKLFGWKTGVPLADSSAFVSILIGTDVWKEMGYGSVIYLAALATVGNDMYDAAKIDGAGRFKQCLYITLPSLLPVISMMFILRLGNILDGGFDQIFTMYSPAVYGVSDIIDTYVYRIGLENFEYSFSTAVGLCKDVIGALLVVSANWLVGKFTERSIW